MFARSILSLLWLVLYLAPSLNAWSRDHKNGGPIFVVNFFLGWTVIGWIVALARSFSDNVASKSPTVDAIAFPSIPVKVWKCNKCNAVDSVRCSPMPRLP